MYAAWLAVLAAAEGATEGPSSPFEVNMGLFVWTWLVFIALFFILRKYAWPAIVAATEEREKTIQAALEAAERQQVEAKAAMEEGKRFAAESKQSAQAMLAEARSLAEKERASVLEKARHEQEALLERARREIAAEKDKALTELRRETVDLSLAAAARLIGQRLDTAADRAIVEEYLKQLEYKT
jgi:F-type H+-transporting ATPase subunit b